MIDMQPGMRNARFTSTDLPGKSFLLDVESPKFIKLPNSKKNKQTEQLRYRGLPELDPTSAVKAPSVFS